MSDNDAPEGGTPTDDGQPQGAETPPQPPQRQTTPKPQSSAGKQPDPEKDTDSDAGKTFTQAELDKILNDRLDRERKKFVGHDDLKVKAAKFDELEAAKKTNEERLNDQLAAREVELATFRTEKVRNDAGRTAGLDPDMWEYVTASDPDEALTQAKRLAERLAPLPPSAANLQQGARPVAKTAPSANDVLRGMAGYQ